MRPIEVLPFTFVFSMIALVAWRVRQKIVRMRHVREAPLPPGLFDKLRRRRPDIDPKQFPLLERALRDFFAVYLRSGYKPVSMPSQAADELWHEFILYTRHYQAFCDKAFGRFLHHTPAVVLSKAYDRNVGLRRVWWHTCKLEGIDPRKASRLPLLFALDTQLALADGFHYALDCGGIRDRNDATGGGSQCAADMSDSSFDGTTDGMGDGGGGDGGDGDGGGDSGCGGGCGGD